MPRSQRRLNPSLQRWLLRCLESLLSYRRYLLSRLPCAIIYQLVIPANSTYKLYVVNVYATILRMRRKISRFSKVVLRDIGIRSCPITLPKVRFLDSDLYVVV